jgi:pimeloyl-ACP methyl ester carboxylesterase
MQMNIDLVRWFCTPPSFPFTDFESKAFTGADNIHFSFEGEMLAGYCWGEGKTVLLIHGWGSRASHMAFLGRFLAKAGFRVIAYDAPAHSSSGAPLKKTTSNMFEYCHAISTVAKSLAPLYAVVGHSFGAMCAAFTVSGTSEFSENKISAEKLVLISTPPTLVDVYKSFCRRDGIGEERLAVLKSTLEKEFGFLSEDYTLKAALQNISADILIVHDTDDEEFPVSDIYDLQKSKPGAKLLVTEGSGHQKILANRVMIARIREHLLDN